MFANSILEIVIWASIGCIILLLAGVFWRRRGKDIVSGWHLDRVPIPETLLGAILGLLLVVQMWRYRVALSNIIVANPAGVIILTGAVCLLLGVVIARRVKLPDDTKRRSAVQDVIAIVLPACVIIGVGLFLTTGAGGFAEDGRAFLAIRGAMGWAFAYLLLGFLGGFLFAVPRVHEPGGPKDASDVSTGSGSTAEDRYRQNVNTNLEQISDWLTKIIVGLGLVELRRIPEHLSRAAEFMAQAMAPKTRPLPAGAASFACAFIIFFGVLGFLVGYLLTRLFLAGAFWRADTGNQPGDVKEAAQPPDESVAKIREWSKVPENAEKLRTWLSHKKIAASLPLFLNSLNYAGDRKQAEAELEIK